MIRSWKNILSLLSDIPKVLHNFLCVNIAHYKVDLAKAYFIFKSSLLEWELQRDIY